MASNAYKRASQVFQKAKGPKWKQELVPDHKFDFIDVEEFRNTSFLFVMRYLILLGSILVSMMVYCADIWTACILLIYDKWSLSSEPKIPLHISKWIYVGCIALSFMLLAWETNKTKNVMATNDISLAVTNPLAYRTYSVKSYSYFCLLFKIKSSTKWGDVITFYVFYTLKGWKRVIIAQGPRQIIAGITLYAMLKSAWTDPNGKFKFSDDWDTYGADWQQRLTLILMGFTCILWVISFLSILFSTISYFFILCQIQGNLKEYCCHKIDKRISELLNKQRKKRIRELEKEREKEREREKNYASSLSSKKSKKNSPKNDSMDPIPALPTLPVFNDANLYTNDNKSNQWMYQHGEQQDSFYYDNQPMVPLESSYALQRNPTNKYNPYSETPMIPNVPVYQPSAAYTTQDRFTDYYGSQNPISPQYSNNIAAPTLNNTSYDNSGYHQKSSSNSRDYDEYSNIQTSPSLQNAHQTHSNNKNHHYDDSVYTESTHIQKSSAYTQSTITDNSASRYYQQSYEDLSNTANSGYQQASAYKSREEQYYYSDNNQSSYRDNSQNNHPAQNSRSNDKGYNNYNGQPDYSYSPTTTNTKPAYSYSTQQNDNSNKYTNYI